MRCINVFLDGNDKLVKVVKHVKFLWGMSLNEIPDVLPGTTDGILCMAMDSKDKSIVDDVTSLKDGDLYTNHCLGTVYRYFESDAQNQIVEHKKMTLMFPEGLKIEYALMLVLLGATITFPVSVSVYVS
jgi:hypothetical protein